MGFSHCNPVDFFLPCGPAKFNKRGVISKISFDSSAVNLSNLNIILK